MTAIKKNVNQTKFRMVINLFLAALGWSSLACAGIWSLMIVGDKLFSWQVPLLTVCGALAVVAVVVSLMWAYVKRPDDVEAATTLDQQANLKERTSTGLFCQNLDDPFALAALADAEATNKRISARSFIQLRWPSSMSFGLLACVAALIVTWLPISPLQADESTIKPTEHSSATRSEVKRANRKLQDIRKRVAESKSLKEFQSALKTIDDLPAEKLNSPQSVRREAVKKMDKLADAVRNKREGERFKHLKQMQRMFRGLKSTKQPKTPTEKLAQALARSDFRAAQESIKELQEQLAKLSQKQSPQQKKELEKQLEQLSKQLQQLSQQQAQKEKLKKELENAGVDKKTAERALDQLTKQDLQQVQKQMKQSGANEKQMQKTMDQMKSMSTCQKQGSNLSDAMQKTAQAMQNSNMQDAANQLEQISDQLNAMEGMQQQLSEMESMLSDLQEMKDNMNEGQSSDQDQQCGNCAGKGCSMCGNGSNKKGLGGMGKLGKGRGGRGPEQETDVRFKKVRTPVITTQGSIISKMFVNGAQVRGDVSTETVELIAAAERDATDAINKNNVPNQYRSAVREYFSRIREEFVETNDTAEPQGEQ